MDAHKAPLQAASREFLTGKREIADRLNHPGFHKKQGTDWTAPYFLFLLPILPKSSQTFIQAATGMRIAWAAAGPD